MNIAEAVQGLAGRDDQGAARPVPPEWAERIAEGLREIEARRPEFAFDLDLPERPPGAVVPLEDPALVRYRREQGERARNSASRLFRGVPSC